MLALNLSTLKSYVDDMLNELDTILLQLFSFQQESCLMEYPPSLFENCTPKQISLSVILFNEVFCKCLFFDLLLGQDDISSVLESIKREIERLSKCPQAPIPLSYPSDGDTEDLLARVIQNSLFLLQRLGPEYAKFICLVTNAEFEFNQSMLKESLRMLIQFDIPLHVLLIPPADSSDVASPSPNCFKYDCKQELELLCSLVRGQLWNLEKLDSSIFLHFFNSSRSILDRPANSVTESYECLSRFPVFYKWNLGFWKVSGDEIMILIWFLRRGWQIDHFAGVSSKLLTVSLILPLLSSSFFNLLLLIVGVRWLVQGRKSRTRRRPSVWT